MGKSNLKLVAGKEDTEPSRKPKSPSFGESAMTDIEKRLTRLETDNEYIKRDLGEIKSELKEIKKSHQDLRVELKTDVANLRTDFQKDIHTQTKWIIATAITLVSLSLAAVKYLLH